MTAQNTHIDIRAHWLRDCVRAGSVDLTHVDTKSQLADMLTKTQLKKMFIQHRDKLFNGHTNPTHVTNFCATVVRCGCKSCYDGVKS